jgi:hypothetical protein
VHRARTPGELVGRTRRIAARRPLLDTAAQSQKTLRALCGM